jgi:cation diffusion facilitator CzcD-associated flavoprotein CzcO
MPGLKEYKSVAVIGSGPSGLSAVKALSEEKKFDVIKVFERRAQVGGTWYVPFRVLTVHESRFTDTLEAV